MSQIDPTIFAQLWGSNLNASRQAALQREGLSQQAGRDQFGQGMARDRFALDQQTEARQYVEQQAMEQERRAARERALSMTEERIKKREATAKLQRALMAPDPIQAPGAGDLNYAPGDPMATVPGGVGPPMPTSMRQVDVGGWDARQGAALQGMRDQITDEDLQWADEQVANTYRSFLLDKEGVRGRMKSALLDLNASRLRGTAPMLYQDHSEQLAPYGLQSLLDDKDIPKHLKPLSDMEREQYRTELLSAIGEDPSHPQWSRWMRIPDDQFDKEYHATVTDLAEKEQAAALQQQVGTLIQKKRSGVPLTPEEEGLLATSPRVSANETAPEKDQSVQVANFRLSRLKDVADRLEKRYLDLEGNAPPGPEGEAQIKAAREAWRTADDAYLSEAQNGSRVAGSPAAVTPQQTPAQQVIAQLRTQLGREPTRDEKKAVLLQAGFQYQPSAPGAQQ